MLNLLGIELKSSNSKKLIEFTATTTKSIYETVRKNNQFKIQLLSAELIYDEIILYSNGHYTEPFNVIFFDSQNRFLHFQKLSRYEHELKIKLHPQFGSFQYVQLASCEDDLISNKLLISDYFLLAKTHPNPKFEKFERICSEIQNGELSKVLDLLHYAIIDETENEEGISMLFTRNNNTNRSKENNEIEKFYDLSTYKPIEYSTIEKNLLLFSPSLRVLDVLKFINSKTLLMNTQEDMRVDEQEEDLDNINGNEENEVKVFCNFSLAVLKSERRKLISFFNKLYDDQQKLIYGKNRPKSYKPTLTDLSKYLIAIELILEYGGKSAKYDDKDTQHYFNYLPFVGCYDNENVKGCCLNLIGNFLMLARTDLKNMNLITQ